MGLVGLTRYLAREGAKYNIRTNVIVPVCPRLLPLHHRCYPLGDCFYALDAVQFAAVQLPRCPGSSPVRLAYETEKMCRLADM